MLSHVSVPFSLKSSGIRGEGTRPRMLFEHFGKLLLLHVVMKGLQSTHSNKNNAILSEPVIIPILQKLFLKVLLCASLSRSRKLKSNLPHCP